MITEPSKKLTFGSAIDEIAAAGYGGNIYQSARGMGIEYQCLQSYRSRASNGKPVLPNGHNMAKLLSAYVRHCGGIASLIAEPDGRVLVAVYEG